MDAAFKIAQESGFSAITARGVAHRLGCSVGPLYANFATMDDLVEAVVKRAFDLSDRMLAKQTGSDLFENIGRASLEFARDYPVLLRELALQPSRYRSLYEEAEEERMVRVIGENSLMSDWTTDERRRLFFKLRVFQTGLLTMVSSDRLPSWLDDQTAQELLLEVGEDLFRIESLKREERKG